MIAGDEAGRAAQADGGGRVWKFLTLVILCVLNIALIFLTYSNYARRQEIDARLRLVAPGETVESITYKANLVENHFRQIEDLRCAQRDAAAFYRLASAPGRRLYSDLFGKAFAFRQQIRDYIAEQPGVDKDKWSKVQSDAWGLPLATEIPMKETVTAEARAEFSKTYSTTVGNRMKAFIDDLSSEELAEVGSYLDHASLKDLHPASVRDWPTEPQGRYRDAIKTLANESVEFSRSVQVRIKENGKDLTLFRYSGADEIEKKIDAIAREIEKIQGANPQWLGIAIEKLIAEQPFFRAPTQSTDISHIAGDPRTFGLQLEAFDCSHSDMRVINYAQHRLLKFLNTATMPLSKGERDEIDKFRTFLGKTPLSSLQPIHLVNGDGSSIVPQDFYDRWIGKFILLPSSIQALIVTIMFGILGGTTINILKMYQGGQRSEAVDPEWGDIVLSPLVGAIAALIVFLLLSLGLLTYPDGRQGAGQLTAATSAFVALAAFISGLLNQEAFTLIRRIGVSALGTRTEPGPEGPSAADVDLAAFLRANGLIGFADLALAHGLGDKLRDRVDMTVLAPADSYFAATGAGSLAELKEPGSRAAVRDMLDRLTLRQKIDPDAYDKGSALRPVTGDPLAAGKSGAAKTIGRATVTELARPVWRQLSFMAIDQPPD